MSKLEGKVAIITGAGRGVGKATAFMLARDGAKIVVNDLDASEARAVAQELVEAGHDAIACAGNVTDSLFPDQLMQTTLDAYGQIDILVNNAGYIWNGAMHNHSDEQWHAMLDVHVTAPFRILRSFSTWLRQQAKKEIAENGEANCRKIVNVSSVSGTLGSATQIAYSSGKSAIVGLTKTLAKEWGRYNVTVNCVAFGHIETRLTQSYDGEPPLIEVDGREHRVGLTSGQVEGVKRSVSLGRSGKPDDGAGAIYLFCIPESNFVTGEVLTCSGGL